LWFGWECAKIPDFEYTNIKKKIRLMFAVERSIKLTDKIARRNHVKSLHIASAERKRGAKHTAYEETNDNDASNSGDASDNGDKFDFFSASKP
jgi:hypothetical protein